MKTGKSHYLLKLTLAAALLFSERAHAYYTNYLDLASNALTTAYISLTSNPTPTKLEKAQAVAVLRALKDLGKPSTSVAGDYALFVNAAAHLGQFAYTPQIAPVGSNVFNLFTNEAQAEINFTAARVAALNDFVRVKRAASNNVAQAQASLDRIASLPDVRKRLVQARLVFTKLIVANKLAANGEAHSGFALNSMVGLTLHHMERNNTGDVHFINSTDAEQAETGQPFEPVAYTYTRTGLNAATLVLGEASEGTTTVKLRFTSATGGTFTFRNVDDDGSVETGSGSFTLN